MSAAEKIEAEASRWLAARDARPPTAEDDAAFDRWIDADIRHRVAYLRLESAWRRADRLHELQPLDRRVDALSKALERVHQDYGRPTVRQA